MLPFSFKLINMAELNITNPEYITWQYEQLQFTLLGGLRIEGMERMRVTIKIEYKGLAIRHNLDLYNDSSLDKLIKKCAERYSLGTAYMINVFARLINELEAYRLQQLNKSGEVKKSKQLTEEERKEAEKFLRLPDLLQLTGELIGKSGVIGEENNRLLMYLIFTSRKREEPLHIISLGSSGTGKSHLQEKVGELMPPEDRIEVTSLSENAFYYFGRQELKHKLILIEDLDGAEGALYPLRELQSKKVITKTVVIKGQGGETQTVHLRVEGPVSVSGCTTQESIYEDNANRSFLIYLDESGKQDEEIMHYQRLKSAGKINRSEEEKSKQLLQNVQRILQPITVRNPFAEYLKLPASVFKPRRTNAHYLQFVEVITFYHQLQREQKVEKSTGETYIETAIEDVEMANKLMAEILLRKSDDLTGACRDYLEQVKKYMQEHEQCGFTNRVISRALRIPLSTVKRHNLALLTAGYFQKGLGGVEGKGFNYELVSDEGYQELRSGITSVLDGILQELKSKYQLNGSHLAQLPTEPVKHKSSKQKRLLAH